MKFNFYVLYCILLWTCVGLSCQSNKTDNTAVTDEHALLNEDSIELQIAYSLQDKVTSFVSPAVETDPISAKSIEDAADDPAIWYNKQNPDQSLIFGSNKKGGISVTNLSGKEIKYYKTGKINNIDILYDFPFRDTTVTLLGCSNRTTQSVDLYTVLQDGTLKQMSHPSYKVSTSKIDDIYGFCFGVGSNKDSYYLFLNGKNGLLQQFEMSWEEEKLKLSLVREHQFDSQTEGMVCHNPSGRLFVGEEDKGVWELSINPTSNTKVLIENSDESNPKIKYDIEGLTILSNEHNDYLIASSQGNFTYAIFDITDQNKYLGSFKIKDGGSIDGVEETDGIDISSDSLNATFPNGVFVVQDGFNYSSDSLVAQNFKYIDVRQLLQTISEL